MRNVGGSIGIAIVTTMVARRSQVHQHDLVMHVTGYDHALRDALGGLSATLVTKGSSPVDAAAQAYGRIYGYVHLQSAALAYIDTIWIQGVACLLMVPLVFLLKKNDPRKVSLTAH
jgi:DHA2 family multidrug resistance protein